MATVFQPPPAKTVRVLQSITVTQTEFGFRPQAWDQRLRQGSGAHQPLPDCPEVVMPGACRL